MTPDHASLSVAEITARLQACDHNWVRDTRGEPVVPPIWVCTKCGKFERVTS